MVYVKNANFGRKPIHRKPWPKTDWRRFRKQWYRGLASNPDNSAAVSSAPYKKARVVAPPSPKADVVMTSAVRKAKRRGGSKRFRNSFRKVSKGKGFGKLASYQNKDGLNHTIEYNGLLTGTNTVWLGHHTFPHFLIYQQAVKLLFKRFMKLCGSEVVATDQILPNFNGVGIAIEWRATAVSTSVATEIYAVTNSSTMTDFVTWWMNAARPWNVIATAPDLQFLRMFIDGNSAVTGVRPGSMVDINNFIVRLHAVSSLKMQNRTKNVDGTSDSTDESDVVPLVGKSYNAKGQELRFKKPTIATTTSSGVPNGIVGDNRFGYLTLADVANTDQSMQEPVQGKVEFTNCKSVGKIKMMPGDIHTSKLSYTDSMYFNTIVRMNTPRPAITGLVSYQQNRGILRAFCLEKVIDTVAPNPMNPYPITVAFEQNYEISAYGYSKRTFSTVKSYEKVQA